MGARKALKRKRKRRRTTAPGEAATKAAHVSSADTEPRKLPRQERARETVVAILAAAAELFADRGYAGTTTNRIAGRAGVSIGSLYQYFPNKDAILAGLMERHHQDVHRVVAASLPVLSDPDVPMEQGLRHLISGLLELHEADPHVTRALSHRAMFPAGGGHHHKLEDAGAEVAGVERLLRNRPDVRDGDHAAMAHILSLAIGTMTRWLVHDAPSDLDRNTLVDETVRLLAGYLR